MIRVMSVSGVVYQIRENISCNLIGILFYNDWCNKKKNWQSKKKELKKLKKKKIIFNDKNIRSILKIEMTLFSEHTFYKDDVN